MRGHGGLVRVMNSGIFPPFGVSLQHPKMWREKQICLWIRVGLQPETPHPKLGSRGQMTSMRFYRDLASKGLQTDEFFSTGLPITLALRAQTA
jgi:hypothetical protein